MYVSYASAMKIYPYDHEQAEVRRLTRNYPVVGIIGPRQSGKTTLARSLQPAHFFDLENPADRRALENPALALTGLKGLIAIDEIQHVPDLFAYLRHLVDSPSFKGRFIVLGSASPTLLKQSSESLAGRIAYLSVLGFRHEQIPARYRAKNWLRGAFPRSLLAKSDSASLEWRMNYVNTFLERDIPQLGFSLSASTLERFWSLLTHNHANILNQSELARAFSLSDTAIRSYLEILESTFMIYLLKPFHENISKRQVKRPKVYFRDSGLYHYFLGIKSQYDLERHLSVGSSWEGFVIMHLMKQLEAPGRQLYFWATHSGAELDLLVVEGSKRVGYEIKRSDAPALTTSMRAAMESLKLTRMVVIYPGDRSYMLQQNIKVMPFADLFAPQAPIKRES